MSGSSTDDAIAAAIRSWRAINRMRQTDLADLVGMNRNVIATIERGERRVTVDDARRLCRATGLSLVDLVGEEAARELRIGPLRPGTGRGD